LELAPELTFEDLEQIKVPIDLLEVMSLDYCRFGAAFAVAAFNSVCSIGSL
jgi:hypothetical protein